MKIIFCLSKEIKKSVCNVEWTKSADGVSLEEKAMKILMLNYEYPPLGGGGGAVCRDISEKLVKENHNVTVLTMNMKGLLNNEIVNGVDIRRINCWRSAAEVCHPWEQMSYCFCAYRYIKKGKIAIGDFDVIHCHFIIPTGILALWLKKKYGKEFILTAHGSDVIGHNEKRFKVLYRLIKPYWIKITNEAKILTAPSDYLIKKIQKTNRNRTCELVPNGIYTANYGTGKKEKYILTLSRLQESKGIQDLMEAASKIELNGWKIIILGEGPYRAELETLISRKNMSDKVQLKGFVFGEEKRSFLSRAGMYFTGSWFEAMPISLLEAMASGCTITASNIEPHRQLLKKENIYTTVDDLAEKLTGIVSQEPRETVYNMRMYDWNHIADKYISLYERR